MRMQASGKSPLVPAYAAAALSLWVLSVVCHDWGTVLARSYFTWASTPGVLHEAGGTPGFVRGEYLLAAALALPALALAALALWWLARLPGGGLRQRLAAWGPTVLVWAALSYLAWKVYIVFASELVHFGQYALIGGLLSLALGGRRPQTAFLLAVGLGCLDEAWQHYILHRWWLQEAKHWFDWSDLVLNALGACGGILSLAVRGGGEGEDRTRLVWVAGAAAAALLLPVALLDPVLQARLMGHYPAYPLWNEYANHKPVYWPQPRQGIPVFLAALLLLGGLLRPGGGRLGTGAVAAACVLGGLALDPPSRLEGQAVHAVVPSAEVAHVPAAGTPTIDGALDEEAWRAAPRLGPLVHRVSGEEYLTYTEDGKERQQALQETYARLLWDEEALYVAFEVGDTDIWVRDSLSQHHDESVTVCIDDGGDEITYYVFTVNAANQVYDYFSLIPAAPMDYNPWNRHIGLPHWDAHGLRTAVRVDGSIDRVERWTQRPAADRDRGYTVEMAIPWENFRTTSVPGGQSIRRQVRPGPGEHWRVGLFRTEYPRPSAADLKPGETVDEATGRALLGDEAWEDRIRRGRLKPRPEDGRFDRPDVVWQAMHERIGYQAWRPTYNTWLHFPAYFGVMRLAPPEP